MGKLNLGKYKKQTERKSGKGSRNASNVIITDRNPALQVQTSPQIHLEDLLITKEELWALISPTNGALKNWLTMSRPEINILKRDGPLAEIANYVNLVLADKIKKKGK